MRSALGFILMLGALAFIFMLNFTPVIKERNDINTRSLDFFISAAMFVLGYYFGTSQSSTDKNEILKDRL